MLPCGRGGRYYANYKKVEHCIVVRKKQLESRGERRKGRKKGRGEKRKGHELGKGRRNSRGECGKRSYNKEEGP